jgi:hypothetical protein
VEAYFIKTYTPPTAARAPFVVGALATTGFCDMHKVGGLAAGALAAGALAAGAVAAGAVAAAARLRC